MQLATDAVKQTGDGQTRLRRIGEMEAIMTSMQTGEAAEQALRQYDTAS
jgi:hypothetical protein